MLASLSPHPTDPPSPHLWGSSGARRRSSAPRGTACTGRGRTGPPGRCTCPAHTCASRARCPPDSSSRPDRRWSCPSRRSRSQRDTCSTRQRACGSPGTQCTATSLADGRARRTCTVAFECEGAFLGWMRMRNNHKKYTHKWFANCS